MEEVITIESSMDEDHHEYEPPVKVPNVERNKEKYARRMAFSQFVSRLCTGTSKSSHPLCCSLTFADRRDLHRHINREHEEDIAQAAEIILKQGSTEAKWNLMKKDSETDTASADADADALPLNFTPEDNLTWLPIVDDQKLKHASGKGNDKILLFYKYSDIKNTQHVRSWQETLCQRLGLTGKVRVSREGLNATVGGTKYATDVYISAVQAHPLFSHISREEFKSSEGGVHHFPDGLRVGVYEEAVPMGIKPEEVSYKDTGVHLTPEEFHKAMLKLLNQDTNTDKDNVLIDCRNFYESRIGRFDGALAPDIRKFSYWPEYVDQNPDIFKDKNVYMYCTGGIRCERGSAYIKAKGMSKEVFQLEGGIHKYIEKYPDGFFKGKLFVFDDRYAIPANDTVISACTYCQAPWDNYAPCSSPHCHQLVLICPLCRDKKHTACCPTCQKSKEQKAAPEQCECTARRARIPVEKEFDPAKKS